MQIVLFDFYTATFLSAAAAKPSSPPSKPAPSGLFGQPGEFHGVYVILAQIKKPSIICIVLSWLSLRHDGPNGLVFIKHMLRAKKLSVLVACKGP